MAAGQARAADRDRRECRHGRRAPLFPFRLCSMDAGISPAGGACMKRPLLLVPSLTRGCQKPMSDRPLLRAVAISVAVLLVIPSGGCSWIGVTSPPQRPVDAAPPVQCTRSTSAPVGDTIISVLAVLGGLGTLAYGAGGDTASVFRFPAVNPLPPLRARRFREQSGPGLGSWRSVSPQASRPDSATAGPPNAENSRDCRRHASPEWRIPARRFVRNRRVPSARRDRLPALRPVSPARPTPSAVQGSSAGTGIAQRRRDLRAFAAEAEGGTRGRRSASLACPGGAPSVRSRHRVAGPDAGCRYLRAVGAPSSRDGVPGLSGHDRHLPPPAITSFPSRSTASCLPAGAGAAVPLLFRSADRDDVPLSPSVDEENAIRPGLATRRVLLLSEEREVGP